MKKSKQNKKKGKENIKESPNNSDNSDEEGEIKNLNFNGNYYIFATTNKKKIVSIPKSSKESGTQLEIDNFTKGGSKQFEIKPIEDEEGMFSIKSCLSGLYLKVNEGFKLDEVIQESEEFVDSKEYKWQFEKVEDDDKCVYIKSAMSEGQDFYVLIEGEEAKLHSKLVLGDFDPEQKFMICRKV